VLLVKLIGMREEVIKDLPHGIEVQLEAPGYPR
jgi:hypothetical protein